jgi:hypothetical protein
MSGAMECSSGHDHAVHNSSAVTGFTFRSLSLDTTGGSWNSHLIIWFLIVLFFQVGKELTEVYWQPGNGGWLSHASYGRLLLLCVGQGPVH